MYQYGTNSYHSSKPNQQLSTRSPVTGSLFLPQPLLWRPGLAMDGGPSAETSSPAWGPLAAAAPVPERGKGPEGAKRSPAPELRKMLLPKPAAGPKKECTLRGGDRLEAVWPSDATPMRVEKQRTELVRRSRTAACGCVRQAS